MKEFFSKVKFTAKILTGVVCIVAVGTVLGTAVCGLNPLFAMAITVTAVGILFN